MEKIIKQRKEDIDVVIEELRNSPISLEGNFKLQFEYIEGEEFKEHMRGFHLTIWPTKDGPGISLKVDPYDVTSCSGIAEVIKDHGRTIIKREK